MKIFYKIEEGRTEVLAITSSELYASLQWADSFGVFDAPDTFDYAKHGISLDAEGNPYVVNLAELIEDPQVDFSEGDKYVMTDSLNLDLAVNYRIHYLTGLATEGSPNEYGDITLVEGKLWDSVERVEILAVRETITYRRYIDPKGNKQIESTNRLEYFKKDGTVGLVHIPKDRFGNDLLRIYNNHQRKELDKKARINLVTMAEEAGGAYIISKNMEAETPELINPQMEEALLLFVSLDDTKNAYIRGVQQPLINALEAIDTTVQYDELEQPIPQAIDAGLIQTLIDVLSVEHYPTT